MLIDGEIDRDPANKKTLVEENLAEGQYRSRCTKVRPKWMGNYML